MTLHEYIEKARIEHNLSATITEIEDYVTKKAKDKLKNKSGAIDDDTVLKWILECKPTGEEKKEEEPVKPAGVTEKKEEEWGEQQSLF